MKITRTQIPAPFGDHHSAAAVSGILSQCVVDLFVMFRHAELIEIARLSAYPRIRFVIEILIARHDNVFGLVLIPFRLDALQLSVGIEEPLRHGEIYRIELILIPRALVRSLRAVEGVLDIQRDGFEILHRTFQRTLRTRIRTIACRIAREFVCSVHGVLGRVVRSVSHKLYAGNIVPALVAVHSVLECRSVYLAVCHLEFVEQVLVVAVLGLAQKQKIELCVVVRVSLGVIRHRHLYLVALAVRGDVQPLRIIHIDIQPVIALHIALIRVAILHEIDDLRLTVLVIRIVLHIERAVRSRWKR